VRKGEGNLRCRQFPYQVYWTPAAESESEEKKALRCRFRKRGRKVAAMTGGERDKSTRLGKRNRWRNGKKRMGGMWFEGEALQKRGPTPLERLKKGKLGQKSFRSCAENKEGAPSEPGALSCSACEAWEGTAGGRRGCRRKMGGLNE